MWDTVDALLLVIYYPRSLHPTSDDDGALEDQLQTICDA